MEKYDNNVLFNLAKGYYAIREQDDDGELHFKLTAEKQTDEDGKVTYKYSAGVCTAPEGSDPFSKEDSAEGFSLEGNIENRLIVSSDEMNLSIFSVHVYRLSIWLKKENAVYVLNSGWVAQPDEDKELARWIEFLNHLLASMIICGNKVKLEALTVDKMLDEVQKSIAEKEKNSWIPIAKPLARQHTHFDFIRTTKAGLSFLGNLMPVNQNGTEYSFIPISELTEHECTDEEAEADVPAASLGKIYKKIAAADTADFVLAETAHEMAELFRMDEKHFDAGHDREQEIEHGLIQRAETYNAFRSFAWTVNAFCEKEGIEPAALPFGIINELVEFIFSRNCLNYTADSFSPTICSGDDLHVYYIPNAVYEEARAQLLSTANAQKGEESAVSFETASLEGLRKELTYLYPVIRTIYDELETSRDRTEALTGGAADILYAWCTVAYAARQPVFTEDGPMNCWWEHPNQQSNWELAIKKESLERAVSQRKEWMKNHRKELSAGTAITFKDKLFVFSGVQEMDEWPQILQALLDRGGVQRTAVSGKTDYLVCNPYYASDSSLKKVQEQRIKGKNIKVILLDDLLTVLHMTVKTPEEQLAELNAEKPVEAKQKHLMPVVRPEKMYESSSEKNIKLTYTEKIIAKGDGYVLELPDSFVVDKKAEDRDFIAYLPSESDPKDYDQSEFIIFAGQKSESPLFAQFRTTAEFCALARGMAAASTALFQDSKVIKYARPDMPGVIAVGFASDAVHANAILGIGGHIQMMRVQFSCAEGYSKREYEIKLTEIFDHMSPTEPLELLKQLDDDSFANMSLSSSTVNEWVQCVNDYVSHLSIARNLEQKFLVDAFQEKQSSGQADLEQLKKDLKAMLKDISRSCDEVLRKAEVIYTVKRVQFSQAAVLAKMEKALKELINLANQYVELDDEKIEVSSQYAASVKARLKKSAYEAVTELLEVEASNLTEAHKRILTDAQEQAKTLREQREKEKLKEKQRKEAEKKQYEADYAAWSAACDEIKAQRSARVAEELAVERKQLEKAAKIQHDAVIAANQKMLLKQEKRKSDAEKKLAALGFFKFREKKAQKAVIEDALRQLGTAKAAISEAESKYKIALVNAPSKAQEKECTLKKAVEQELPLPAEPEKPAFMKLQKAAAQTGTDAFVQAILDRLSDGEAYTISELIKSVPELANLSNQQVAAIMRMMEQSGKVTTEVIQRKRYFSLR